MADFFLRAAAWRVGHGAEGPWQHFYPCSAVEISKPFGVRPALSVAEGWLRYRFYGVNSITQLRQQAHPFQPLLSAFSRNLNESPSQQNAGSQKNLPA